MYTPITQTQKVLTSGLATAWLNWHLSNLSVIRASLNMDMQNHRSYLHRGCQCIALSRRACLRGLPTRRSKFEKAAFIESSHGSPVTSCSRAMCGKTRRHNAEFDLTAADLLQS
mmetsp:Transcript_157476/g.277816  ORF Transcript_157476/g.277816 Transcript_157476/m.277816 type:complete len:114 (-) Transcript_157476:27-368(-)